MANKWRRGCGFKIFLKKNCAVVVLKHFINGGAVAVSPIIFWEFE